MRTAFLILVSLHGLIHLLGFVKGVGLSAVSALSLPISKPVGLLWLISTLLFLLYAFLQFGHHKYAWLIGFMALLLSQILIILVWKDAKWGTLPNVLILLVSIVSFGSYHFQKKVEAETAHLLNQSNTVEERIVTEQDISALPDPVKKWLGASGMIGKPYIRLGKLSQEAEMKMKPDQKNWLNAKALQYSTIDKPAFIWSTRVSMNPLLFFLGRDKFEEGQGDMLIKLNALFPVVNEQGEKIDEGALQRYLGEMVWFPSLALSPYITWEPIDTASAKASMEYKGTQGSGTFYFNSEGDFVKFSAQRFMGNEQGAKRHEWVLLVDAYKTFEGIRVPAEMTATWKLEAGDWTWLKLKLVDVKYNENTSR
ncbi:MAG TPA: DUF6544 family protein [Saprospiraceae bacterium]|nr:DUF6544 family protein [Saprospiraceae bacterium]